MAEIGFYHLTRRSEATALARLLGRTLDAGERALVLAPDAARVAALDEALWLQDDVKWLPHGTAAMGDPELQPIWIATSGLEPAAPNGAAFLFLVGGADAPDLGTFRRVFDLFDAREPGAIEAARVRFRNTREAGHAVTYWREGERGFEQPRA